MQELEQFLGYWKTYTDERMSEYQSLLKKYNNDVISQLHVYLLVVYRDNISSTAGTDSFRNELHKLYCKPAIKALGIDEKSLRERLSQEHKRFVNSGKDNCYNMMTTIIENEISNIRYKYTPEHLTDLQKAFIEYQEFEKDYMDPLSFALGNLNNMLKTKFEVFPITPFSGGLGNDRGKIQVDKLFLITNEFKTPENIGMYLGFSENNTKFSIYPVGIGPLNNKIISYNENHPKISLLHSNLVTYTDINIAIDYLIKKLNALYSYKNMFS